MSKAQATIGVLLVTHGRLGHHLVDTLSGMLGDLSLPTELIEVHRDDDPEQLTVTAAAAARRLEQGVGVLVLTDAFGSTPSNIANRCATGMQAQVVAGINLPMLIRVYNYPNLTLDEMVASAIQAGRNGVLPCNHPSSEDAESD